MEGGHGYRRNPCQSVFVILLFAGLRASEQAMFLLWNNVASFSSSSSSSSASSSSVLEAPPGRVSVTGGPHHGVLHRRGPRDPPVRQQKEEGSRTTPLAQAPNSV